MPLYEPRRGLLFIINLHYLKYDILSHFIDKQPCPELARLYDGCKIPKRGLLFIINHPLRKIWYHILSINNLLQKWHDFMTEVRYNLIQKNSKTKYFWRIVRQILKLYNSFFFCVINLGYCVINNDIIIFARLIYILFYCYKVLIIKF